MQQYSVRNLRVGSITILVSNEPYGWTEIESSLPEILTEPQPDFRKFKNKMYRHFKFVRSVTGSLTRASVISEEMFSHICAENILDNMKTSCLGDPNEA